MMKEVNFDHVDSQGQLILSLDGEQVVLALTDELERGILSAKQIQSESSLTTNPVEASALPISSIQALVRQGQSTAAVAGRYAIEESLVRRFTQSVETEKRYAIAQFLAVRTQTGSATRSLGELIDHNLREAGVSPQEVAWEATKQSREPWKIVARFANQAHEGKATWMWNLKDHSVVSIDPSAKRLLGENASADALLFGEETASASRHSIQAALDGRGPIPPAWLTADTPRNDTPRRGTGTDSTETAGAEASGAETAGPATGPAAADPSADGPTVSASAVHGSSTGKPPLHGRSSQLSADQEPGLFPQEEAALAASGSGAATTGMETADMMATDETAVVAETRKTQATDGSDRGGEKGADKERKRRRSAIPSWDDILFGDREQEG